MSAANHALVRRFIAAMTEGNIRDDLITDDFHVWIVGHDEMADRESYVQGIALLPRVFPGGLPFTVHSITAEEDRVIAEFSARATTVDGEVYRNNYLYLFRIRAGKVCFLAEYLDLDAMRGILVPAMMKAASAG